MSKVEDLLPLDFCAGCGKLRELFHQSWRTAKLYCSEQCCVQHEEISNEDAV